MSEADAIEYFLEDMTHLGKSKRTLTAYERQLRRFAAFLDERDVDLAHADRRDCLAYIHDLREEVAPSTVATYAAYLNRFYGYMNDVGEFESNPMALVMEELPESVDRDPTRRDISLEEMQSFVLEITHPLDRAVVMTLLKTGVRVGELCNLDLRDVGLTDSEISAEYPILGDRGATRDGTIYVDSTIQQGASVNGEERSASNKRKRDTHIPIDRELAVALQRWLAIRPCDSPPGEPVFVSTRSSWGERLTPDMVRRILSSYTDAVGWYDADAASGENVTPHYFRHFFTTHLRDRTGDRGIVKYLRGDVADDIIDTYTHNWGDRVRTEYMANIYSLIPNGKS